VRIPLKIGFILLFTAAAISCKEPTAPPKTDTGPFVVLLGSDVSTFDPQIPFEVETSYVLGNIFDTLVEFDSSFRLKPSLATRWTNPDDKTWHFYLNDKARFSDGSPLTASDVKFSIERLKSLVHSDLQGFAEHIDQILEVNSTTVEIKTTTPLNILNNLVFIPIMSKKQVEQAADKIDEKPFGTGPFRLVSYERKKRIVLESNEHYSPKTAIQRVEFLISEDPNKLLDDVLRIKPDITMYIPYRKIEEFERKKPPELALATAGGITVEYLVLNTRPSNPDFRGANPLADLRFRQALAYGTNRAEIVQNILKGFGRPATQLVSPEIFGFDPSINSIPYDPAKAQQLIAASNHQNTELPIYTLEGGSYRLENLLIDQWKKIRLNAKLKLWKDSAELNKALNSGAFSVAIQGYSCTSGDASELLTFSLHTRDESHGFGKGNYAGYSNAEVDHISEENLHILNPRLRLEMLQKSMRIVVNDLPYLPLTISPDIYVVSNRIQWTPPVTGELKLRNITFRDSSAK
jgi:peptide/nickel transport system substrate-binding protein